MSTALVGTGIGVNAVLYNDFYEYNQTSDSWTQKASMPDSGRYGAIGFGINSDGFVGLGGINSAGTSTNTFYYYEALTNTWTQKASFPGTPRNSSACFRISMHGFECGGIDSVPPYALNELYQYNISQNLWIQRATLPATGRYFFTGFSIGTKGYIVGGYTDTGILHSDTWEYSPAAGVGLNELSAENIQLYPNPDSDYVVIEHNNIDLHDISYLSISGTDGKEFLRKPLTGADSKQQRINLPAIPVGLYLLRLHNQDGTTIGFRRLMIAR